MNKYISPIHLAIKLAGERFGVPPHVILGRDRGEPMNVARQFAMYLARIGGGFSYHLIAKRFERDHSTVLNAVQHMRQKTGRSDWLDGVLDELLASYREEMIERGLTCPRFDQEKACVAAPTSAYEMADQGR